MGGAVPIRGGREVGVFVFCSHGVRGEKTGDRWLRLGDLAAHEVIVVRCPCERSVEFPPGFLQRRHRFPSDTLVFDLQFRLRCKGCNRRSGFRITIFDVRTRGDNLKPRLERVVWRGSKMQTG